MNFRNNNSQLKSYVFNCPMVMTCDLVAISQKVYELIIQIW